MTTWELIGQMRDRGVTLVLEGGSLRCQGPGEVLTPEVLAELRAHKQAVLEALAGECEGSPGPCLRCGRAARPDCGAERLLTGELVCGDCLTPEDLVAGSVPVAGGGAPGDNPHGPRRPADPGSMAGSSPEVMEGGKPRGRVPSPDTTPKARLTGEPPARSRGSEVGGQGIHALGATMEVGPCV